MFFLNISFGKARFLEMTHRKLALLWQKFSKKIKDLNILFFFQEAIFDEIFEA